MSRKINRRFLLAGAVLALLVAAAPKSAAAVTLNQIVKGTYGSYYNLRWDGHQATLELHRDGTGLLWASGGQIFGVRATYLTDQQTWVDSRQGPGYLGANSSMNHRVVFWIDLSNTPGNPWDDQRFDGYFFTGSLNAMAGVTWWANLPFGFYATYAGDVIG